MSHREICSRPAERAVNRGQEEPGGTGGCWFYARTASHVNTGERVITRRRVTEKSEPLQHVGLCGCAAASLFAALDFFPWLSEQPLIRPDEKLINWMRPNVPPYQLIWYKMIMLLNSSLELVTVTHHWTD